MKSLTIKFPDSIEIDENDFLIFVASKLYETGKLSLGQAAELSGFTKRTFAELLGKHGVSIVNYPAEEIVDDINNA
ncbi:MAG: UPF0175 family protein [Cyclobacteriaceae bacterium]